MQQTFKKYADKAVNEVILRAPLTTIAFLTSGVLFENLNPGQALITLISGLAVTGTIDYGLSKHQGFQQALDTVFCRQNSS